MRQRGVLEEDPAVSHTPPPGVPVRVEDELGVPLDDHVDTYVDSPRGDPIARWFMFIARLPASLGMLAVKMKCAPKLFADYRGKRVRVTMASRFGDVGITTHLERENGYQARVLVKELSNFGDKP